MSSHSREELIGRSYEISIGEPWDFVSDIGKNKLIGTVLDISKVGSNKDWIIFKVSPFQHEKKRIEFVAGVNRYLSSQDIFGEIEKGNNVTLNFMYALDGHELKSEQLLDELKYESNFSFLVGSIVG